MDYLRTKQRREAEHSGIKTDIRNSQKTPSVFVIKINMFNVVQRDNRYCENLTKHIHSTRAGGGKAVFLVSYLAVRTVTTRL